MKSIWDHPLCDHEYEKKKKKIGKSISEDTPHLKSALNDFDQLAYIESRLLPLAVFNKRCV